MVKKKCKLLWKLFVVLVLIGVLGVAAVAGINGIVIGVASKRILSPQEAAQLEDVDCILVLGCLVNDGGVPSDMLHDRLRQAVELHQLGAAPKLLMSGDHGRTDYNEVGAMKQYAMDNGVPSEDVFMDHAGFSTYETVYRAKAIFEADKVVIVTQEYHLYRALHIAKKLGVDAYGVSADLRVYGGQTARDLREVLARCKDVAMGILKPKPTYLGETIPISGSGDLTND